MSEIASGFKKIVVEHLGVEPTRWLMLRVSSMTSAPTVSTPSTL